MARAAQAVEQREVDSAAELEVALAVERREVALAAGRREVAVERRVAAPAEAVRRAGP